MIYDTFDAGFEEIAEPYTPSYPYWIVSSVWYGAFLLGAAFWYGVYSFLF